jgi:hypothetical protein
MLWLLGVIKDVEMDANDKFSHNSPGKITMLDRGRFFSLHVGGTVYYDSRHRIYKVPMEGGFVCELVQELQVDGTFRDQFLTARAPSGHTSLVSY